MESLTEKFNNNERLLLQTPSNPTTIKATLSSKPNSPGWISMINTHEIWLTYLTMFIIIIIATCVIYYFTLYQRPTNQSFHTLGNGSIDGDLTLKGKLYVDGDTTTPEPLIQYGSGITAALASGSPGTQRSLIVTVTLPVAYKNGFHATVSFENQNGIQITPTAPIFLMINSYTSLQSFSFIVYGEQSSIFGYTWFTHGT